MLKLTEDTRIYVADKPVDCRKAINGLAALVIERFDKPANDGSVYVFYNGSCDRVKCLFWDKNGFVLYHKRLERGRFKMGKAPNGAYVITQNQLDWLLAGLDFQLMNDLVPPKSPLGAALFYSLTHWEALNIFLFDGRLELDNNFSERTIKPFVIGRKNWLFHGNDLGAKVGSIPFSLIETCKQNKIETLSWFKYVLTHIRQANTLEQLEKLLRRTH